MLLKLLLPLALLHCVVGRVVMMPKFYGQDSAIIVDTDKTLQPKLNPKLHNAFYYNIPVYKFFKPTTTTSTTTAAPSRLWDEYPSDLLHIARTKLGFKRTNQLPSLSELGALLGTGNAEETVKYIRALTANEQGISLMKAYLGALDYEQSEEEMEAPSHPEDQNDTDNNASIEADYEAELPKLEVTTKESSLMQRVNEFMQQYGMWSEEESTTTSTTTTTTTTTPAPAVVPRPVPYRYPIPLRSTSTAATPQVPLPPHLNSPKVQPTSSSSPLVPPHIQQLAQIADMPPAVLQTFLQQQPKLAELAKRVSRLPLVQQHSKAIDGQLLVAVKKALSQDENLKRLLATSQTLK